MPFDERDFPGAAPEESRSTSRGNRGLLSGWLFAISGMIGLMVVLGGVTRLTGSGLSIMEWAPLRGTLPPTNQAEWERLFELYRQIPQFQLVNSGFGLDDFKHIFWLEWLHRVWGRLLGLMFLGPLVFFWATNRIDRRLRLRLAVFFLLGGLQGVVGWFMVASGFLPDTTAVSAYRLVIHLGLALLLYGTVLWTALSTLQPHPRVASGVALTRGLTLACCGLVVLTMLAGGFVAGTHAGLDYNTFPLMDGRLVPAGYARLQPFVLNWFENIAAVQFNHRLLATVTAITGLAAVASGLLQPLPRGAARRLQLLGGALTAQYALGVLTLINAVPVTLAAIHQASAMIVLAAALATIHALRRVPRRPSLTAAA